MTNAGIPIEYRNVEPTLFERIKANIQAQYPKRRICPPDNDGTIKNVTKFGTGQITLSTLPQQIVGFRKDRKGIKITNLSTSQVWIGCGAGISITNGDLLAAGVGNWNSYDTRSPIFGIVAVGTANISFSEVYE